jgi:hypothetical protein
MRKEPVSPEWNSGIIQRASYTGAGQTGHDRSSIAGTEIKNHVKLLTTQFFDQPHLINDVRKGISLTAPHFKDFVYGWICLQKASETFPKKNRHIGLRIKSLNSPQRRCRPDYIPYITKLDNKNVSDSFRDFKMVLNKHVS